MPYERDLLAAELLHFDMWSAVVAEQPAVLPAFPGTAAFAPISGVELSRLLSAAGGDGGATLSGLDLREASLSGARMACVTKCLAQASQWRHGRLAGAHLVDVDAREADARHVSLVHATLDSVAWDRGDLRHAHFGGAHLHNVSFVGADLRAVSFRGATLRDCDFTEAQLFQADLTEAVITNATFRGARVEELKAVHGARLTDCLFSPGASFRGLDLSGCVLHNVTMVGVDMTGARLSLVAPRPPAQFTNVDLTDALLGDADLQGASFLDVATTGAQVDARAVELARANADVL